MSQELRYSFGGASFVKGGVSFIQPAKSVVADVAGTRAIREVQVIGTTEEALQLGELSGIGFYYFENLDATNYVEIGALTGDYDIKLPPGGCAFGPAWDGAAVFAKAHTAPVNLQVFLVEP